ncbi:hypothetical protein [Microbulbifer taiwanensis]|uniref:hypothetical protein n=1 Tax=Microbulbifer taiwanensis TaxID=986746 RepID=UPI003617B00C
MRSQRTAARLTPALVAVLCGGLGAGPATGDDDWAFDTSGAQETWSSDYELTLQLIREREQLFAPWPRPGTAATAPGAVPPNCAWTCSCVAARRPVKAPAWC